MASDSTKKNPLLALFDRAVDTTRYKDLHWEGSFFDYLELVRKNPKVARNSFQRVYDMILSVPSEVRMVHKRKVTHYSFFDDLSGTKGDAVFGIDESLETLVGFLKSAAYGYGAERRVLLLHGPVGSSKSTIARLLKRGLEHYSRTDEGAIYTYDWQVEGEDGAITWERCPMHEEPLKLLPSEVRADLNKFLASQRKPDDYTVRIEGELNPFCRSMYRHYLDRYQGDWRKVLDHVRVRRLLISEQDRVGVGTFQPKDEKNQDSTELTGDLNYRKIAEYGSDSDPRAFNFDGEFNIANRGLIEFIEILKLDVAFLYDLLGATQEHAIKPKKFSQTDIDEVILGHTNEPEYRKLQNNELMEAFRDRTVKIDVPYNVVLDQEMRIYQKTFTPERTRGKHIAPHTIEVAAMWAVLTRLSEPTKNDLSLLQKMKLYNGKMLPGYTEDNVRELREESSREGMEGISPRYIQDKVSNALVRHDMDYINPFMVLNELEGGLDHHSLIASEDVKKRYRELLVLIKQEYEDIVKNEVQRAISADEEAITRLCANYIDHIKAFTQKERVRNKYTGEEEEADERFMRSIEEKIKIVDARKDDFRREIMNYIGALALEGKTFNFRMNERLQKALELKLFEDQKDSIKLTSLVSNVVDKETQEKIDVVKSRLINNYGYNEQSAADVLNFVASIFARGDVRRG